MTHHHEPKKNSVSTYAWAVIIASIVLSIVLIIVALHDYRTKRAARMKRQKAAEDDQIFGGVTAQPLTDSGAPTPPAKPPNRPQRGRSLVYAP